MKIGKSKKYYQNINELVRRNGKDILVSKNHRNTINHIQHGNYSVRKHAIDVARTSLRISESLGIKCNQRELVRGALLHDYFLYDWHDKDRVQFQRLHGFHHPGIALKNAEDEYELSEREKDIIKKHMWPLTVVPPMCREAWIVTAADKYCSLLETIYLHKTKRGK